MTYRPKNEPLQKAKSIKNDEYYTLYDDVYKTLSEIVSVIPNVFEGKTVFLPCDSIFSKFRMFFVGKFKEYKLKRLITTCYNTEEEKGSYTDCIADDTGTPNIYKSGTLEGDGDFRSKEIMKYRDESDFIITNPPFSLFRSFFSWVIESEKKFLIISPLLALSYVNVFKHFKDGDFYIYPYTINGFDTPKGKAKSPCTCSWITNFAPRKEIKEIPLITQSQALKKMGIDKFNTYSKYDNPSHKWEAIDIPRLEYIPGDYPGIMGVPVSYMKKHNNGYNQFNIIENVYPYILKDGVHKKQFTRILIQRKTTL